MSSNLKLLLYVHENIFLLGGEEKRKLERCEVTLAALVSHIIADFVLKF